MGAESPGLQTIVEGYSILGSSPCLASSVSIYLTASAVTELAEHKTSG